MQLIPCLRPPTPPPLAVEIPLSELNTLTLTALWWLKLTLGAQKRLLVLNEVLSAWQVPRLRHGVAAPWVRHGVAGVAAEAWRGRCRG